MMPRPLSVLHRVEEYPGTVTLQLGAADNQPLPAFLPGQFNMLYAFGCGEVPISFSSMAPADGRYCHTIKTLGAATGALTKLRPGDSVGVRGPFGHGWPVAKMAGRDVIIIAGGLGLAPLRPVIQALLNELNTTGNMRLFYGARQPSELLYRDELAQWSKLFAVQTTVDMADARWRGHIGNVNSVLTPSMFPSNSIALVCGPEVMMRYAIGELLKKQLPPEAIYLSMERNMKCATGHCGHCQWGPQFVCKDGPVFCYRDIQDWFHIREL